MANGYETALSWRIKERAGYTTVEFLGEITEDADFAELSLALSGTVNLNLGGVRRINSCGIRAWIRFVRDLPRVTSLSLSHCSPAVVSQLNVISNFRGNASIVSFFAPFVCETCDREEIRLIDVGTISRRRQSQLPPFECPGCGNEMELDELPEHYLAFLHED